MAEQTIMLNCSAGMSIYLLVTKMQQVAKDQGIDANIFACTASDASHHIEQDHQDSILLGPQIR